MLKEMEKKSNSIAKVRSAKSRNKTYTSKKLIFLIHGFSDLHRIIGKNAKIKSNEMIKQFHDIILNHFNSTVLFIIIILKHFDHRFIQLFNLDLPLQFVV